MSFLTRATLLLAMLSILTTPAPAHAQGDEGEEGGSAAAPDQELGDGEALGVKDHDVGRVLGEAEQAAERKSVGQRFIDSDEVKAALERADLFQGKVRVEVKTITSGSTSGASTTTGLVVADRQEMASR